MQVLNRHSASGRSVKKSTITVLAIGALEQLRALLAPGLDGTHRLLCCTAANACLAVELGIGEVVGQPWNRPTEADIAPSRSRRLARPDDPARVARHRAAVGGRVPACQVFVEDEVHSLEHVAFIFPSYTGQAIIASFPCISSGPPTSPPTCQCKETARVSQILEIPHIPRPALVTTAPAMAWREIVLFSVLAYVVSWIWFGISLAPDCDTGVGRALDHGRRSHAHLRLHNDRRGGYVWPASGRGDHAAREPRRRRSSMRPLHGPRSYVMAFGRSSHLACS